MEDELIGSQTVSINVPTRILLAIDRINADEEKNTGGRFSRSSFFSMAAVERIKKLGGNLDGVESQ